MSNVFKGIKTLKDFDWDGKSVFLRLDLNVPIKDGEVLDDGRILASFETLKHILKNKGKVVIGSHLGRPKGKDSSLSLFPVAKRLQDLLDREVIFVESPQSDAPRILLNTVKDDKIILLENLRFHPDEMKNGEGLCEVIASYTDIYINDAFGTCHRRHASMVKLPEMIPQKGVGSLVEKEIQALETVLGSPESPFLVLLGGKKVSDKIDIIENLLGKADTLLVGGAMAYTFLKAEGFSVGDSFVEKSKLTFAKAFLERVKEREKDVFFPLDHIISSSNEMKQTQDKNIPSGFCGVDIGPLTRKLFIEHIKEAKTIFWNGPMGVFEEEGSEKGSLEVAEALTQNPNTVIVGGGDSMAAMKKFGLEKKIKHLSSGGGASLEYLRKRRLVALEALREKIIKTPWSKE